MKTLIQRVLIGYVSSLLGACSGDNQDLKQYIDQVKYRTAKALEPIPDFAALPGFKFPEDEGRRNPFKPTNQKKQMDVSAPEQRRERQTLEAFPLDALKFVGTLRQGKSIWALIKLPDSQITRIREGDCMGQNYGHIVMIKNNVLKLEETVKSSSGAWKKRVTTLDFNTGK